MPFRLFWVYKRKCNFFSIIQPCTPAAHGTCLSPGVQAQPDNRRLSGVGSDHPGAFDVDLLNVLNETLRSIPLLSLAVLRSASDPTKSGCWVRFSPAPSALLRRFRFASAPTKRGCGFRFSPGVIKTERELGDYLDLVLCC